MQPFMVSISGGSCAGKSSLARALTDLLPHRSVMLAIDSFFKDNSHIDREARKDINFDSPDAVDVAMLQAGVNDCLAGRHVEVPRYDFELQVRTGIDQIEPGPLLVVEGNLALHFGALRDIASLKIYIDVDDAGRLSRRVSRDVAERGRTEAWVKDQWNASVLPMHREFVEPTLPFADEVIDGLMSVSESAAHVCSLVEKRFKDATGDGEGE